MLSVTHQPITVTKGREPACIRVVPHRAHRHSPTAPTPAGHGHGTAPQQGNATGNWHGAGGKAFHLEHWKMEPPKVTNAKFGQNVHRHATHVFHWMLPVFLHKLTPFSPQIMLHDCNNRSCSVITLLLPPIPAPSTWPFEALWAVSRFAASLQLEDGYSALGLTDKIALRYISKATVPSPPCRQLGKKGGPQHPHQSASASITPQHCGFAMPPERGGGGSQSKVSVAEGWHCGTTPPHTPNICLWPACLRCSPRMLI